jgi:transcriptional regulator with XRE-family HTH domain
VTRTSTPDAALAATLRRMREQRGISREALAFRAGVTASALARVELAQSAPGWDTVCRLARALDVTMVQLSAAVEAARTCA